MKNVKKTAMLRLTIRHTLIGMLFWLIGLIFSAALLTIIALVTQLFIPFSGIASMIVGGLIAIPICLLTKRLIYKPYNFESKQEGKKNFWQNNDPIYKSEAYCSLLPMLLPFIASIAIFAVFYADLSKANGIGEYIYKTAACAAIGGGISSPIAYAIITAKSFVICSNCKAVNSLIFDEELSSSSSHGSASYGGVTYGGVRSDGIRMFHGSFDPKSLSRYAERTLCHCKHCRAKNVCSSTYTKFTIFK